MTKQWFSREEFEDIVSDALDSLPKRFVDLIENVAITIEDEPADEDLDDAEDADGEMPASVTGL